jgi:hypothetical protein
MPDNSKRDAGELSTAFPAVLCAPDVTAHSDRSCQLPDRSKLLGGAPSFSCWSSDLSSHRCSPTPYVGAHPADGARRSTARTSWSGSPSDAGEPSGVVRAASASIELPYNAHLPPACPESPPRCWPKHCYSRPASAGSCYAPPSWLWPVCRRSDFVWSDAVDVEPLSFVNVGAALTVNVPNAAIAWRSGLRKQRPYSSRVQRHSGGAQLPLPSAPTSGIGAENRLTSCFMDNEDGDSYECPQGYASRLPAVGCLVAQLVCRAGAAFLTTRVEQRPAPASSATMLFRASTATRFHMTPRPHVVNQRT